ncbi:lysophospholipid acyltransferase family protein [Alteromonas sp. CYL-A6]|uniref:lysophospholipid acyltransferase family protein n=1 Tax=Alteromonas nitratireducens TaxID=3390813 RepID=UPI0034B634B7
MSHNTVTVAYYGVAIPMSKKLSTNLVGQSVPRQWPHWLSGFAQWLMRVRGWQAEGELANRPKMVISVAPHTSNWDFFIGLFVLFALRLKVSFFGKHTLFFPPLSWVMKAIGGIPVERSRSHGMVGAIADKIKATEQLLLVLAPEGTRRPVYPWKTGFMQIAKAAGVPVQLIGFDYIKKRIIFGPVIEQVIDINQQMQTVYAFYASVTGKFPEKCRVSE